MILLEIMLLEVMLVTEVDRMVGGRVQMSVCSMVRFRCMMMELVKLISSSRMIRSYLSGHMNGGLADWTELRRLVFDDRHFTRSVMMGVMGMRKIAVLLASRSHTVRRIRLEHTAVQTIHD